MTKYSIFFPCIALLFSSHAHGMFAAKNCMRIISPQLREGHQTHAPNHFNTKKVAYAVATAITHLPVFYPELISDSDQHLNTLEKIHSDQLFE